MLGYWYIYNLGRCILWLHEEKTKITCEKVMVIMSFFALIDYMFFGKHYDLLNPVLQYENGFDVSWKEQLINLIVLGLVAAVLIFLLKNARKLFLK